MSYTLSGSHAGSIDVYVATNAQLAELIPGVEYVDGDEDQVVLVFEDPHNQSAYIIEGSWATMDTFLDRGVRALAHALADREGRSW